MNFRSSAIPIIFYILTFSQCFAESLFSTAVTVNNLVITNYDLSQRELLYKLLNKSGNIKTVSRKDLIDMDRIKEACKQAQIHDFIIGTKDGYSTQVGEQGIRLSGGQRQRLGIARALYKNARILIFDEATSSLDSKTEGNVMESIEGLNSNYTIIVIAHRLSTIRDMDSILVLNNGNIESQGRYDDLINDSPIFRSLATVQFNEKNNN